MTAGVSLLSFSEALWICLLLHFFTEHSMHFWDRDNLMRFLTVITWILRSLKCYLIKESNSLVLSQYQSNIPIYIDTYVCIYTETSMDNIFLLQFVLIVFQKKYIGGKFSAFYLLNLHRWNTHICVYIHTYKKVIFSIQQY